MAEARRLPSGVGWPHLQAAWPPGPPISLSFERRFSTALKIKSTLLLKVGLIRGSRIDATPYISYPPRGNPPPSSREIILRREEPQKLHKYFRA
jgi:hypothetical protein